MNTLHEKPTILVVDDDAAILTVLGHLFEQAGYQVRCATSGAEVLGIFQESRPQLVISDIRMPGMLGTELLQHLRSLDESVQIIMTTGDPDMQSAIDAVHAGAFDYVVKPFRNDVLLAKATQALQTARLASENLALSELAALHDISLKLSATHDLDDLIDVTFSFAKENLKATNGALLLWDKNTGELSVTRESGTAGGRYWPVSRWVARNRTSMRVAGGVTAPTAEIDLSLSFTGATLAAPLMAAEEVVGVLTINRPDGPPFSGLELNIAEVLAAQAGSAINNALLYDSLRQRLSELSLVGGYAEKFMGVVDLNEVIERLFSTVKLHFPIDLCGFLSVKKRYHDFLWWSRCEVPDEQLIHSMQSVVDRYNAVVPDAAQVNVKRVKAKPLTSASDPLEPSNGTFSFEHIIPLVWGDESLGALYFGARTNPGNRNEMIALLSSLVSQTRIALTNARLYSDMKENYIRTIKALAIAVDAKDNYTHGHSENVMNIAEAIALEMQVPAAYVETIKDGGLLHDIGKIGIPGTILNKPGPLSHEEFNGVMKTHVTLGANIVRDVPFLRDLHALILYHHEHHDGSGYPEGLKGDEVPLGARILHVADAFEAMTSNRPYRASLGKKEAVSRLAASSGSQFDPVIVDAFMKMAEKKGWLTEEED